MRSSKTVSGGADRGVDEADATSLNRAWGPYPSPRSEARFLLRSIACNGDTVETLRRSIAPDPEEEEHLRLFAARDGEYGKEVLRVLDFRRQVLAEFEQLTSSAHRIARTTTRPCRPQKAPKLERCCPACGKSFKPMTEKQWRRTYQMHLEFSARHDIQMSTSASLGAVSGAECTHIALKPCSGEHKSGRTSEATDFYLEGISRTR